MADSVRHQLSASISFLMYSGLKKIIRIIVHRLSLHWNELKITLLQLHSIRDY